jgi:hypothetical protein
MAIRYPIISGNWSNALIWNGGTLPTSADDVYSNGFTVTINQNVTVLSIRNTAQSPAVAGGGYILLSGYILSATNTGIVAGSTTCVTYSATSGTSTINANISGGAGNVSSVLVSGNATLNVNGNINSAAGTNSIGFNITGAAIVSIVGNLTPIGAFANTAVVQNNINSLLSVNGTIQNVNGSGGAVGLNVIAGICNITGTLLSINASSASSSSNALQVAASGTVFFTGNFIHDGGGQACVLNAGYFNAVGTLVAGSIAGSLVCTSTLAINICTGPFVSNPTGIMPFLCVRMHYVPTLSSYLEFRDNSTNGALPPAAPAPATRLVSPDTVVDSPIPANVRDGVSYALNTLTGTLKVPAAASVGFGVPVDNTVGSAALTPASVWNVATSTLTTASSIGERLKNASTVDTTGDQLAALL